MRNLINPQIFFLYNHKSQIKQTFFLTYKDDEELKKTKEYQLFLFYKKKYPEIFYTDQYEIINDHILLTLTVGEIRGYIQKKILKTDLKILVFSLWDNIDYYVNDYTIFNPFTDNQIYKEISNETIIYEVYKNIFITGIFCVIDEENYFNKKLCRDGIYNNDINTFVKEIISQDLDEITDIKLDYEKNKHMQYNINWTENILYDIKSIDFYKKNINEFFYDNYFISGDELILMNNENEIKILKENSYTNIILYETNFNNPFIQINNHDITVDDMEKFKNLTYIFPNLEKMIIKKKIYKEKYKIDFNINIKSKLIIFYENNFFIFETKKTKNIFLDRTKKINIIISKNHILFNGYNLNFELCVYLTKLILGYQIHRKDADYILYNKKVGTRYYSRYCQTVKKPVELENFDPTDPNYKNINNIYFEHLHDGRDVYYDNDKQKYVTCLNPDLSNISFINELYQGYNICLPCCYKKKKNKTLVFNKCVENEEEEENIVYEPYIHIFKQYRTIMDENKIGVLNDKIKDLFNKNTELFYFNKKTIEEINSSVSTNEKKTIYNFMVLQKFYNFKKLKYDNIFVENTCCDFKSKNEFSLKKKKIDKIDETETNNIDLDEEENYIDFFEQNKNVKNKRLSEILDSMKQYIFINKNKRILLAKNYIVYTSNKSKQIIEDLNQILEDENLNIYIFNNSFYFNPKILSVYQSNKDFFIENVNFFLIIKNTIHILKSINKLKKTDNLTIDSIPFDIKKKIIEKYFELKEYNFEKTQDNVSLTDIGFFINKKKIEPNFSTKYLYSAQRITLKKQTLGYYIVNVLYKKYFLNFYFFVKEDEILFKKTFLINLLSILKFDLVYDKIFIFNVYKNNIKEIIKILNKNFINEKELKKYT